MARDTMADLVAFLAVARERSFTRAAAQLGVSPSALSHTIRKLEERVGRAPPDAHDAKRVDDGSRRAPVAHDRPALRRDTAAKSKA